MANRKLLGAAAMVGVLGIGGVAGVALGAPGTSGASRGAATTTTVAGPGGPGGHGGFGRGGFGGGAELEAAAKALNMTVEDLQTQLRAGKSIADVAKTKKVDRQTVVDAMVAAAKARLDKEEAALPDRIGAIVDGKRPTGGSGGQGGPDGQGGPGGHGGFGGFGFGKDLADLAKTLKTTEDDLRTQLRSGKSLADIAKSKGVSEQTVIDALVKAAKAHLADAVKSGHLTQAQADKISANFATTFKDLVEGKRPAMGPGGPGGFGGGRPGGHFGGGQGGPGTPGGSTTTTTTP